jgi:hypothetical protein
LLTARETPPVVVQRKLRSGRWPVLVWTFTDCVRIHVVGAKGGTGMSFALLLLAIVAGFRSF